MAGMQTRTGIGANIGAFFWDGYSNRSRDPAAPQVERNLTNYIAPQQLERIKQDMANWRESVRQAELAFFPQRYKMQQMYVDTILNEQVFACAQERKRLTKKRENSFVDDNDNDVYVQAIDGQWFTAFIDYALDALFYGYSLISLGDVVNDGFPHLTFVPRVNVSPDRMRVSALQYGTGGIEFQTEPYKDWHIWVGTPTETGSQSCGYGLFYKIAKTEIFLRNNTGFNADFIQTYGQPVRVGKTTKTQESERATLFQSLINMANQAAILLDEGQDTIELVESKNSGTGYKSYADFEERLEKKISKVILGHADAMDSVPGKLGGGGAAKANKSPAEKAKEGIQLEDGEFIENLVNNELVPRMRNLGFVIPDNVKWVLKNNGEKVEERKNEDEANGETATIAYTMSQAGLKMDAKYFQDRTGIPTTDIEIEQAKENTALTAKVQMKMEKLYSKHK